MDIILYNPLSRSGKSNKIAFKLHKKLNKKGVHNRVISLLEIQDLELFLKEYDDINRFIIVGGDGTLNVLSNNIKGLQIKPDIYLYVSGTGNDFARSIGVKKGLVDIKKYLYNLPVATFNDEENHFLNGIGLGLDGLVVYKVNNSRHKNTKFNYFRHAFEAFREHKKAAVEVTIDGVVHNINDSWFVSIMNSAYFGGGMKIAPKQKREQNQLSVVIVRKIPKFLLIFIFPIIYLGLHTFLKRYVKIIKANEVEINFKVPQMMQMDGEDYANMTKIKVKK